MENTISMIKLKKGDEMKVKELSKEEILEKLKEKRQKCMVYTRVMGYHRPVESFNIGKKAEHRERKYFKEN
jgi:anaerobic ribonucleoside-triphosphate reductase